MFKFIFVLYLIVFSLYVLFTRQPDFFDGETTPATVHIMKDSAGKPAPFAFYSDGKGNYRTDARYLFRHSAEGSKCSVIYDPEKPQHAAVYVLWGYWLTWQELIFSSLLIIVLFQIARAITRNPTPEGLISELEDQAPPRKRRYDD